MTTIEAAGRAFRQGCRLYEKIRSSEAEEFTVLESYGEAESTDTIENTISMGDNLRYMEYLIKTKRLRGKLQLIYADPPFFSGSKYQASLRIQSPMLGRSELIRAGAYDDRWGQGLEQYLCMLTVRFLMMKELLGEEGSLWVHLDWHVVHYVKLILDNIFGQENFINEIIWTYKSGGSGRKSFAKKHDTLLLYGKSNNRYFLPLKEKSYNRGYRPYRFKNVEEFCDDTGWYTMVNMKDVWNIDMVGRTSAERNGYATQKPEKLLQRIIESCSRQGDICADFFAGSGTLGSVCETLGRKWIMCDESSLSVSCQIDRMAERSARFCVEGTNRENVDSRGRLDASFDGEKVELHGYVLDEKLIEEIIPEKHMKEIRRYLEGDSLSLIRYWSVDFDYDGIIHRPNRHMTSQQRSCTYEKNQREKDISIAGYDILGNRFFHVIKPVKKQ